MTIIHQRRVGERHLALKLRHQGDLVDAMWFGHTEPLPPKATLAFRLDADAWQGQRRLRFLIEGMAT
jgi:single-stranded-DNA-specific exonuclease